jgi:hypothetical protein
MKFGTFLFFFQPVTLRLARVTVDLLPPGPPDPFPEWVQGGFWALKNSILRITLSGRFWPIFFGHQKDAEWVCEQFELLLSP